MGRLRTAAPAERDPRRPREPGDLRPAEQRLRLRLDGRAGLAMFAFAAELAFGTRSRVGRTVAAQQPDRERCSCRRGAGRDRAAPAPAVAPAGPTRRPMAARRPGGEPAPQRRADQYGDIGMSLTVAGAALLLPRHRAAAASRPGAPPWGNMYEFSTAPARSWCWRSSWSWPGAGRTLRYLGLFVVVPVLLTLAWPSPCSTSRPDRWCRRCSRTGWPSTSRRAIVSGGVLHRRRRRHRALPGRRTAGSGTGDRGNALSRPAARRSEQLDQSAYRLFAFVLPAVDVHDHRRRDLGRERLGHATGAGTPRRPGRSSPGWSTPATCTPARPRAGRAARPRTSRWPGSSCFVFNYFGVNIWFAGLHSYAGLPNS